MLERISHYRLLQRLGAGGMGEVYLGEDTQLGRKVAIKILPTESGGDEQAGRRLIREARAAATLDHHNICAVYEVGEDDGRTFIALREAFASSGMPGYWRKLIEQLKAEKSPQRDAVSIAALYARLEEKDQALDWLKQAYSLRSDGITRLKEELAFDSVRSDPRFVDLLKSIGLPL